MSKKIKTLILLLIKYTIGIVIIYLLYKKNHIQLNTFAQISGFSIILTLSLAAIQLFLAAWRLKTLLWFQGVRVKLMQCILYNSVGVFYSTILPGGISGDAVRAYYYLKSTAAANSKKSAILGTLVTDRILGTLSLFVVGLIALTYSYSSLGISNHYLKLIWLGFIAIMSSYIVLCKTHQYTWIRIKHPKVRYLVESCQGFIRNLDLTSYPLSTLFNALFVGLIIHFMSAFIIYVFALQLNSGLHLGQIMAVVPIGLTVNALPISPGGLGVGEQGFEFLFTLVHGTHGGNVFMLSRPFLYAPAFLGVFYLLLRLKRTAYFSRAAV